MRSSVRKLAFQVIAAFGLVMAVSVAAFADVGTTYSDAATGVSFTVPASLHAAPASRGVGGRTTQAIFSTFSRNFDPRTTKIDLTRELTITAYVASRGPNEDLRALVARSVHGAPYTVRDLPRLRGIVVQGLFEAGPRAYALIPRDADHVLVVDAFPTYSSRFGLFESVLATLAVK
jgi:hypothetical protein